MYSASFSKASLTEAKRSLGPGKSALKTALRKADKAFLEARRAVAELAPGTALCPRKLPPPRPNRPACWTPRMAETAFALPEPLFADGRHRSFFGSCPPGC